MESFIFLNCKWAEEISVHSILKILELKLQIKTGGGVGLGAGVVLKMIVAV